MAEGAERVFYYQRHLRQSDLTIGLFFAALIIAVGLIPMLLPRLYLSSFAVMTRLSITASVTVLLVAILFIQLNRQFRQTCFIVTDEKIIKRSPWGTMEIFFEHVDRFYYKSRLFGGIKTGRHTLRLPFIIDELPELIRLVQLRLTEQGNLDACNPREIKSFLLDATVSHLSTLRTFGALSALSDFTAFLLFFNGFIAYYFWHLPVLFIFGWMSFGAIFPLMGYLAVDFTISKKVRAEITKDPEILPDPPSRATYLRMGLILGLLYLASGIFYRSICTWWSTI
jgi:hypothetical protein